MIKHNMHKFLFTTLIFITLMMIISGSGLVLRAARAQAQQPTPTAAQTPDQPPTAAGRSISVIGSGEASVQPDVAVILVGVQTTDETASEALTQNSEQMQELIDTLTDAGVEAADIRTQSVQLYPVYEPQGPGETGQPDISGYTAANTVSVRVEDLEQVGELLDSAVQAGGNRIDGILFETSDSVEALEQARELAMENARAKAEHLASLANASLGAVINIQEVPGGQPPVLFPQGGLAQDFAVPVQPGSQILRVDIQVTWELLGGASTPGTGGASGGG